MFEIHHVILRTRDRFPLAESRGDWLEVARAVLCVGERYKLALFRAADNHVHMLLACPRAAAGRAAQAAAASIARHNRTAFEPSAIRAIEDSAHLARVIPYIARQASHHGLTSDPWAEASNVPDLLGLRPAGAHTIGVLRALVPRLSGLELRTAAGWPGATAAFDAARLPESLLAVAMTTRLSPRTPLHLGVAVAASHVAAVHLRGSEIDSLLGQRPRTGRRLRAAAPRPALVRAIELQFDLRTRLGPTHQPGDFGAGVT
jgi:hypothetical protein